MYGYIYKTTNKLNGKIYVGQHKHETFDKHYIGSGVLLQEAIERFGADNFTCEIIESCDSLEELNLREMFWIAELQAQNPDIGYNISPGGQFNSYGFLASSEEYQAFIDFRRAYNMAAHWWTDGTDETFNITCPEGWVRGRSPRSAQRLKEQSCTVKGKIWVTDGHSEKYVNSLEDIPEGWVVGRIPGKKQSVARTAWNKGVPNDNLKHTRWVCNKINRKQVPESEILKYLAQGWKLGMYYKSE